MKIIEIKNGDELSKLTEEFQQFRTKMGIAESSNILVGNYNQDKGKFLVVDKNDDLVYEVDKLYICRHQNTHMLDYKIEYCEIV